MKTFILALIIIAGSLLIYGTQDMPNWGDPQSPASTHVSPYYIQHSMIDMETPNIVSSVLADYRGYDTMGETTVIFTAAFVCLLLLRRRNKEQGDQ